METAGPHRERYLVQKPGAALPPTALQRLSTTSGISILDLCWVSSAIGANKARIRLRSLKSFLGA
jgi:hypothetical protein